jgi:transposase
MAGRFEGLSDEEWAQLEDLFPEASGRREECLMPLSEISSTLCPVILITGCRWCDAAQISHLGFKKCC